MRLRRRRSSQDYGSAVKTNFEQSPGYCTDSHCALARKLIQEACSDEDAHVYFVAGGTQANVCVISALLRSFQGCVCVESGHINVHEAGAVEATVIKFLRSKEKTANCRPRRSITT